MHADRGQVRVALAVLLVIGIVVNAAALILYSRSLSGIRGDVCSFAQSVHQASLTLPQVPGRVRAEGSYVTLIRQLGCKE